jgi:RNA polymerase sigma factor (sigma-70 family)
MRHGTTSNLLLEAVYDDLRAVAKRYLRSRVSNVTLQPTEVVHEACLHIMRCRQVEYADASHFRAIVIRKMWQVIIDHLKRRRAQKRGGFALSHPSESTLHSDSNGTNRLHSSSVRRRVPLEELVVEGNDHKIDLMDLAETLALLRQESTRLHDVVLLHWFGGLTHAEVGLTLGVSTSTAEKEFRYALAWMNRQLQSGQTDER